MTRDASACEKHFPPVISGESGRRPPPRRFAPRGRTSPYSPEMTGGTYIYFKRSLLSPGAKIKKSMAVLGRSALLLSFCETTVLVCGDSPFFDVLRSPW